MNIAVYGAGSFGTALAILLSKNGHSVSLYSREEEAAKQLDIGRENKKYLPDIKIPADIIITSDLKKALTDKNMIVLCVPSIAVRDSMEKLTQFLTNQTIAICSKGFEEATQKTLSDVVEEIAPPTCKVGALSGPTHAEELAREIPSAAVAASTNETCAKQIQEAFMNSYFRVYTSPDILGVELGGALKNVIALAAGISDGIGLGDNTKAALMTRGIKEIADLGASMGANAKTFSGLTGIGDLIVTCTSMHSRNRRAGILLGEGYTLEQTLDKVQMVVEGANAAKTARELSLKYNVNMPIVEEVNNILMNKKTPKEAVLDLMRREKTNES